MDESLDGGSPSTTRLVLLLGEASSIKTLLLFLLYYLSMRNSTFESFDLVGVDFDP